MPTSLYAKKDAPIVEKTDSMFCDSDVPVMPVNNGPCFLALLDNIYKAQV